MDHETVTPHPGANTAWHRTGRGGWLLVGMIGGEDYRSSQIVEVDIARQLAKTTTGKVRHVPGPWPDLDLPAMSAPAPKICKHCHYPVDACDCNEVMGDWHGDS